MPSASCVASYDHVVAVGRLIVDGGADVRNNVLIFCDRLHEALAPRVLAGEQVVIDEVGSKQFVKRLQVSIGLSLHEAAHQCLVLFARHSIFLLANTPTFCRWVDTMSMMPPAVVRRINRRLIHRSAWNTNSRKFRIAPALCSRFSYVESRR